MSQIPLPHSERHMSHRAGWIRAGVLGANDGIVSTACLVLGVAAATAERTPIVTAGVAGLTAGALSMAVGEYVSVSSQRDTERADIAREKYELDEMPERELNELTHIYIDKGLRPELAREVAIELSKGDVLKVHLSEELGITEETIARPIQASITSMISFAIGAALPLATIIMSPAHNRSMITIITVVIALALLGVIGAKLGGAPVKKALLRVVLGGVVAMLCTIGIGNLLGTSIS